MRKTSTLTAVIALIAVGGFAALSPELGEWGKGPVQHLMTKEEAAAWKNVRTDEEAQAFIALFWAKRDPSPATPRNEIQEEFDRRVKAADEQFPFGRKMRGSLTDRGKALILFGKPTKVERTGTQRAASLPSGISEDPANNPAVEDNEAQIWTYEGGEWKDVFGVGKVTLRFVDRFGNSEFRLDRSSTADVVKAQERAVARYITQPGLTAPPTFQAATPPAPAAPDAPAVVTELASESLRTAVAEFRAAAKSPYEKTIYASWGEFVTSEGKTFVPLMLYVPKSAGFAAGQELTFFGVVQDASGANVLAFEEPARLVASKEDFYVDRTVILPAGKHRAFLGLAENGKPVSMVATDLDLAGSLDKDAAAVSRLILSNNLYPLMEAQAATDPFAFGGVKVVPKGDRRFRATDELWYFFEMRNPGVVEPAAAPAETAEAAAPGAAAPAAAEPLPRVQVKIDVEGTTAAGQKVKRPAPLMEVAAIPMKGVPGHYGVGSAIPLASFKPGDYTFTLKVIDTVKKASYTLTDKFTIVE